MTVPITELPTVMAFAGAFGNNSQLQQFVLPEVTPTGRLLGTGSYGSVEEVSPSA